MKKRDSRILCLKRIGTKLEWAKMHGIATARTRPKSAFDPIHQKYPSTNNKIMISYVTELMVPLHSDGTYINLDHLTCLRKLWPLPFL